MNIRLATPEDATAISRLLLDLVHEFISPTLGVGGLESLASTMTPEAINYYLDQGYDYHVGIEDEDLIGVVALRDGNHLYHLFVDSNHQGKRYASQLWMFARNKAMHEGNPGLFTVNSSLNAQEVYKAWGFRPVGRIRDSNGVRDIPMMLDERS